MAERLTAGNAPEDPEEREKTTPEPVPVEPIPENIYEGDRYNQLMILACSMKAQGQTEDEILSGLRIINETRCEPPGATEDELTSCAKDVMRFSTAEALEEIEKLKKRPITENEATLSSALVSLNDVETKEAEWLIPGMLPKGQVCLLAADGGTGKTWIWCDILAKLSAGKRCILDDPEIPFKVRDPARVMFFSSEDSVSTVLKPRLEQAGANFDNITTITLENSAFRQVKFDNPALKSLLNRVKPELCVFDPIQGFIPEKIKMSERNAMRQAMTPLIGFGEEFGTTFLLICHCNKRAGAYGRQRVADSTDIWDLARCVLIAGETEEEGIKYVSQEKNNYGPLMKTVLFSITPDAGNDQILKFEGLTKKKDRDYVTANEHYKRSQPEREEAKNAIENILAFAGGHMRSSDLEREVIEYGIKKATYKRARDDLKKENVIEINKIGMKNWYVAVPGWYESLSDDEKVQLAKPPQAETDVKNIPESESGNGEQMNLDDL